MAPPISFGVELEFNIAYTVQGETAPDGELRTTKFPITDRLRRSAGPGRALNQYEFRIFEHIATLFNNNGLTVNQDDTKTPSMKFWQVTDDSSIADPDSEDTAGIYHKDYEFHGMEVISPALEYNQQSLAEVKLACDLLRSNYVVGNSTKTGTHVHIGRFSRPVPFSFLFMKKIFAFLYMFEPQINSIHEVHRTVKNQNSWLLDYVGNIRDKAPMVQREFGLRPLPAVVISAIMNLDSSESLYKLFGTNKFSNYNIKGLVKAQIAADNGLISDGQGHTIEFRQHAGTLNSGGEIVMWIRVLAGIINYIEDVSPESFNALIGTMMVVETWEKEYDGKDEEREQKYGPVPADGSFTIVDLLNHIGLPEEAEYYSTRWKIHAHSNKRPLAPAKYGPWDFEGKSRETSEEYKDKMRMGEFYTDTMLLKGMDSFGSRGVDLKASFWPKRRDWENMDDLD